MENGTSKQGYAEFGERVEKTGEGDNGWRSITDVDLQDTVCLVLGGQSTWKPKTVNGYCKDIEKLLKDNNLRDKVRIIGVINHYGDCEPDLARKKFMAECYRGEKSNEECNEETLNPKYIEDIYNTLIKPRLVQKDADGKETRLPLEEACKNMRKLNIYAHCHGGYTAMKLEQLTQQKMAELGYSQDEAQQIQKNLLVVAYAPFCPLGKSKSTMISFASGEDKIVKHDHLFEHTIHYLKNKEKETFPFSYLKRAKAFYVPTLGNVDQHEFIGLTPQGDLSPEGEQMMGMLRSTLLNGLRSSLQNQPLRDIQALTGTDEEAFNALKQNGDKMWERVVDCAAKKTDEILNYTEQNAASGQTAPTHQDESFSAPEIDVPPIFAHLRDKVKIWIDTVKTLKGKTFSSEIALSQDLSSSSRPATVFPLIEGRAHVK